MQGKTVVLVTHDIGTVQRYCDRAMLLQEGGIEILGDPQKVCQKYIYQNMSDEEKRIFDEEKRKREKAEKGLENMKGKQLEEEKRKKEEERRNKVAEITKVEFLDKNGKVENVFQTGDNMSIRVYFRKNESVGKLNFGIAIYDQESNYIFGTNTIIGEINTQEFLEKGYYQLDFAKIPLKTNTYFIKSGIFGENDKVAYDFLDKSNDFKVISNSESQGLVELNCNWN